MSQVCIYVICVKKCPYCGEDHGERDFYGTTGSPKATTFCPRTLQIIVAEREGLLRD